MEKSAKSKQKDLERKRGKMFIKMVLNTMCGTGSLMLEKDMTFEEVGHRIRIKELANLFRELEQKEKEKDKSC